ncbi:MAG: asparagine synthase (glutamine-hydrolyzing) [Rhodospirillaceae bacterium]|jgi:asparagine synthase (glutamine-hydrolysing)|nr:asparagine synthase (glutamine-hydrolyzing) [Rhodospirillaceae bacterium]MBT7265453.1 asparagine synthase (glutamine-hydrolyzing) [Rhodospirillaceae bacterium]
MCGLTAIFSYGDQAPPVDEAELLRMREAMIARGPDGAGLWLSDDRRVGLAHRRLAIIDVGESGAQPMALRDESGNIRLQISYNGEIYNFKQLRAELMAEGRKFTTNSDTEVLLHLYDRDGAEMLRKLRGMFAFALWDEAKQGMLLARDPYGIKPLYYADEEGSLRVASQVKALLAGGAVSKAPNPAGHVGFFTLGYVPEPHTMYKNIHSLPAGSSLWLGRDGRKIESRYFDFRGEMQQLEEAGPEASQDELRAALMESVEHHLVSDVPVGVFLSAGLDSASIMALVAEVSGSQMESMTLRFDEFSGTASDEAPLAEEIAKAYNTRHQTRTVKGADFQADQAKLLAAMDQPSIDGVNTYFVAKEAADMGLKVALSGVGGDELLGGYDSFRQIPSLVGKLGWIPGLRPLGAGFRVLSGPVLKALTSPKYASLLEYSSDYGSAYLLRRGLFMPWELPEFMDADIVREGWQALNLLENMNASIAGIQRPRNKVSLLESLHYMRGQLLRDADWAGMAHSLEIRTPLVDATLFTKLAGRGYSKQAMAITPKFPMPSSILNRPKTGFAIPVRDWLQGDDGTQSDERGVRGWAKSVYATLK